VTVSAGRATCTTSALPAGTLRIVASYSGDSEYLSGSAEVAAYTVTASLALTGPETGQGQLAATGSAEEQALANTGSDISSLVIAGLFLTFAGCGVVAFGSTRPRRRPGR
jgi:hypothetical protein